MIALILGGTRSGKSAVAEDLISQWAHGQPVTYLATALVEGEDGDHQHRIAAHVLRRPSHWITQELGPEEDLAQVLAQVAGPVLIDSLGTWLIRMADYESETFDIDPTAFLDALSARHSDTVIVGEEVGLAVHAPTRLGRRYVDAMGLLNQRVASVVDHTALVVAGQVLPLSQASSWMQRWRS